MKRIKISRHGKPREKGNGSGVLGWVLSILTIALSVGVFFFLWNSDISEFMPSSTKEDVAIQEQVTSISDAIDSYVEENSDDIKSDGVVSSEVDKQSFDNMRRGKNESAKYVRILLSPTVDGKKIEDFEVSKQDTYNIRGTAEHYTIEVYSTGLNSYNDFDDRLIYDSDKGFVNK